MTRTRPVRVAPLVDRVDRAPGRPGDPATRPGSAADGSGMSTPAMRHEAWLWVSRGAGAGAGIAGVIAVAFVLLQSAHVLLLVIVSVLLASGLEPFVGWLRGRTGAGRAFTILLVYAGFLVLVAVLVVLVVPAAMSQVSAFTTELPGLLQKARDWVGGLRPPVLADGLTSIIDALARGTATSPAATSDAIVGAGLAVADAVVSVITVLTLVFFWLTGHQRLQRFVLAQLPAERRAGVRDGWNEVETRMGLWVRGQLVLMTSILVMTTIAYFVIGLPNPLLLGLIAGIAEVIPIVGPALGAVPALFVAVLSGQPEKAILVAVVYLVIQVVEGNVLVPMVMRSTIGVPPFLVVVSLLVGSAVAGLPGALLALPVAAGVVVILERVQERDRPVLLESPTGASAPTEEERQRMEVQGADGPGPGLTGGPASSTSGG
jgi:predicted PurR-regulated permease PerM